uniref:Uncharacterized protein n=1 Tax=Varanus komodoensis TaxID=61221 RepID=A0A8D2KWD5_VARKO
VLDSFSMRSLWPLAVRNGSPASLPPPPDDNLSGASGMEVDDRISYLEQRLQLQEDEIQVLKAALADVLRRLSTCEENDTYLRINSIDHAKPFPTKICIFYNLIII